MELDLSKEPLLEDQLKKLVGDAVQVRMQWFLDELKNILPVKESDISSHHKLQPDEC